MDDRTQEELERYDALQRWVARHDVLQRWLDTEFIFAQLGGDPLPSDTPLPACLQRELDWLNGVNNG